MLHYRLRRIHMMEGNMPSDLGNMNLEIDKVDLMKRVDVTVTFVNTREWNIRMWTAKQLLILASWISKMNIEFVEKSLFR